LGRRILRPHDVETIFGEASENTPVEIEIGCGNGHFISEYAKRFPHTVLIGIDRKKRRCEKSVKKTGQANLTNTSIIWGQAEAVIERLPVGRIRAFHIYFPDPWPKSAHRKRRLFRNPLLDILKEKLERGGVINFSTDFFDYYIQAKLLISLHKDFILQDTIPPPELQLSLFNRRLTDVGRSVFYLSAIKR
jgi:tRNA (guanine-N7-)-methyltransferase